MTEAHRHWMHLAIEEGELARGSTGDNPWVGCVIVSPAGALLGRGHTLGPGEAHAEIAAARDALSHNHSIARATLYSTLEPCAFHGRTPACAHAIVARDIARVILGMRDPHPRVSGAGIEILRAGHVEVVEGVSELEIRRQLGSWVLGHHPEDAFKRVEALPRASRREALSRLYGVDDAELDRWLERDDTGRRRALLEHDD